MVKEVTIQKEPANCENCLLNDFVDGYILCRYYTRLKNIPFPQELFGRSKPSFCKIRALTVQEEAPEKREN